MGNDYGVGILPVSERRRPGAYQRLTDASGAEVVKIFGAERARSYPLIYKVAHNNEHYGNIVTCMRLKGLVPPSSQR